MTGSFTSLRLHLLAIFSIYNEIDGCLQLIRYSPKSNETFDEGAGIFSKQTIIAAVLTKMKYQLAGTVTVHYNAKGNDCCRC